MRLAFPQCTTVILRCRAEHRARTGRTLSLRISVALETDAVHWATTRTPGAPAQAPACRAAVVWRRSPARAPHARSRGVALDASSRGWHACAPFADACTDDRSASCLALAGAAAAAAAHRRRRPGALRPRLDPALDAGAAGDRAAIVGRGGAGDRALGAPGRGGDRALGRSHRP